MSALIDTNILIAAALCDGIPEKVVLHLVSTSVHCWIATQEILEEYIEVLNRPKFKLPQEIRDKWSALITNAVNLVPSPQIRIDLERDPKDAKFLEAAAESDADIIVTGDKDLLDLKNYGETRILSPAEYVTEFCDC